MPWCQCGPGRCTQHSGPGRLAATETLSLRHRAVTPRGCRQCRARHGGTGPCQSRCVPVAHRKPVTVPAPVGQLEAKYLAASLIGWVRARPPRRRRSRPACPAAGRRRRRSRVQCRSAVGPASGPELAVPVMTAYNSELWWGPTTPVTSPPGHGAVGRRRRAHPGAGPVPGCGQRGRPATMYCRAEPESRVGPPGHRGSCGSADES